MNEVIIIQQKINDYTTTVKVDKSVKRFEVEFNGGSNTHLILNGYDYDTRRIQSL